MSNCAELLGGAGVAMGDLTKKRIFLAITCLCIGLLLALPLSFLWWDLWMYHGLVGAPPAAGTDGEAAYDSVHGRMFYIAFGVTAFLSFFLFRKRPRRTLNWLAAALPLLIFVLFVLALWALPRVSY